MNFRLTTLWLVNNPIDLDLGAPEAKPDVSIRVQFAKIQLPPSLHTEPAKKCAKMRENA
jgi:hypothetical protein